MARRRTVGFDKGLTSRVGVRTEVAQNRRRFAPKQAINGRAEQLLAERRATGKQRGVDREKRPVILLEEQALTVPYP
jgi:hypothetical protein